MVVLFLESQNIYFKLAEGKSAIYLLFKSPGTGLTHHLCSHFIDEKGSPNHTGIQKTLNSQASLYTSLVSLYKSERIFVYS